MKALVLARDKFVQTKNRFNFFVNGRFNLKLMGI